MDVGERDGLVAQIGVAETDLASGAWLPTEAEMVLADRLSVALDGQRPWSQMHRGIVAAVVELGPGADLGRLGDLVVRIARRVELYELAEVGGYTPSADPTEDAHMLSVARDLLDRLWGAGLRAAY